MTVIRSLRAFFSRCKTNGLFAALQSVTRRSYIRYQEWQRDIRTEATIELSDLGIHNPECKQYSPTHYGSIREVIRIAGINPRDHVFLDFGAGMGRAMILAAGYPFRRVLGVEIASELTAIAEKNFARCKHRLRCQNLEIVTGDAAEYRIPSDVTFIYFYNPFFGDVLSAVLDNVRASLASSPRHILIVCNLPLTSMFESQIAHQDWLRLQNDCILSANRRCLIYSTQPLC